MVFGLFIWAQAFGLYLLLAGEIDNGALLAAGPSALAAAMLGALLHRGTRGTWHWAKRDHHPFDSKLRQRAR